MIARLAGKIVHIGDKYTIIDVSGVGYKVYITSDFLHTLSKDRTTEIWIYTAVRENSLDLYGFSSPSELNTFELLLTVSGIGPKTALSIMSATTVETLHTAIQNEDASHLIKVSGIGKKVAEKIVRELADKVEKVAHTPESKSAMKNDSDALEALKSLGYSQSEARNALKDLPKTMIKTNEKVKEALKILGR